MTTVARPPHLALGDRASRDRGLLLVARSDRGVEAKGRAGKRYRVPGEIESTRSKISQIHSILNRMQM
jgi:hypothetical protein